MSKMKGTKLEGLGETKKEEGKERKRKEEKQKKMYCR